MADLPPRPGVGSDRGSTTSTPRWVKVFGLIALGLILLFLIQHLAGNILGGGGLHTPR